MSGRKPGGTGQLPGTNTWRRCQYLLRQGLFVADLCYMQAEAPPQSFHDHPRTGYGWDECSAEAVLTRMTVRDGRLVLPDGMSYRLLVLPESSTMTLALLGKVKDLVRLVPPSWGAPRPVARPQRLSRVRRKRAATGQPALG